MQVDVAPYSFSQTDVRKTLHHAEDLLDLYPDSVRPAQQARRERIGSAVAGVDPMRGDVDELAPVLRSVWPDLLAARDDLIAVGALPATTTGSVHRVSRSGGGVPKLAADRIDVGFRGVVGDRQASRVHHGRPWQALCLWSLEVIEALAADGHPIAPGAAGENVTITGVEWPDVRPGVRLRLGTVLCQVMAFAVPCQQNAQWFSDGDFRRIHHDRGPISRTYAVVLEPGEIHPGAPAILEPG